MDLDTGLKEVWSFMKFTEKKRKNTGSTMVEVLVGFTLLMILMVGMTRLVNISSEMVFKTRDMMNKQSALTEEFYKSDHGNLSRSTVLYDGLILEETDSSGKNIKADGVSVTLPDERIEKLTDDESGLSVYQIYKDTAEP
jgi:hypothetical protein